MTSSKRYELLKDLPDAKAGDVYSKEGASDTYYNEYTRTQKSPVIEFNSYFSWQVEDNPEWFRLIPDEPAKEETFTWNEVREIIQTINDEAKGFNTRMYLNSKFNDLMKSKQQPRKANDGLNSEGKRVEVNHVIESNGEEYFRFIVKGDCYSIMPSKLSAIKEAIERIINNEDVAELTSDLTLKKMYTQSEVLKMQRDAFVAGRGKFFNEKNNKMNYDYPFFNDYLQSLNQSTKQP